MLQTLMIKSLFFTTLLITIIISCKNESNINDKTESVSSKTFFKDHILNDRTGRFGATGKLIRTIGPKTKAICTGTLISENIVVTAAHCVGSQSSKLRGVDYTYKPSTLKFYPNFGVGPKLYSQVVKIYTPSAADDIAFIEIKSDLGKRPNSTMELDNHIAYKGSDYQSLGYPRDYKEGDIGLWDSSCSMYGVYGRLGSLYRLVRHDCLQAGGSSGGPIFKVVDGTPYIVAVMIGEATDNSKRYPHSIKYNHDIPNLAVSILENDLTENKIPAYIKLSNRNFSFHFCNKRTKKIRLKVISLILEDSSNYKKDIEPNECQEYTIDNNSSAEIVDLEIKVNSGKIQRYTLYKDMPPEVININ